MRSLLRSDDSAQAAPIGVVLLLAIVMLGTTAVVVLGSVAMEDAERASQLEQASNEMTLFDARVATVALGESTTQTVTLGASGTYSVDPNAGWISVTHKEWDGAGTEEEIYKGTLGAVVLQRGDETIAYQGGGVWREGPHGEARLVSPPEFHYRGATLTLPAIRVRGSGAASGQTTVRVTRQGDVTHMYPDPSTHYGGDSANPRYLNPASKGYVTVKVHSQYYEAWAQYFRSRTSGDVTTYESNQTAVLELLTLGERGGFQMPSDVDSGSGGSLTVRGLEDDHSLSDFTITLVDNPDESADMSNLQWSMFADEGNRQVELHLRDNGSTSGADVYVYYSDDGGSSYQSFESVDAVPYYQSDVDGDGEDETVLEVDFTGDTKMKYSDKPKLQHFSTNGAEFHEPGAWDQHEGESTRKNGVAVTESVSYASGDTALLDNVTSHYFGAMGGEFNLKVDDKNGGGSGNEGSVEEEASNGNIDYPGSSRYITYVHVTENDVEVELD